MTTLLPPPPAAPPQAPPPPPARGQTATPLALAAALGAVRAAGYGLVVAAVVVLAAWVAEGDPAAGTGGSFRLAGLAWLVAHHAPLALPTASVDVAPIGLLLVTGWLLHLAGRQAARSSRPRGSREVLVVTAVLAGVYAALAAGVALASATDGLRSPPVLAAACAGTLAVVAGGSGVVRGCRWSSYAAGGVPLQVRTVLRAAVAAVATVVCAGAALGLAAVLLRGGQVRDLAQVVDAGPVGGLVLALLGAAFVPNAAVWGASVLVGPGFALGEGTSVTLGATQVGAVPAFPLLAAVPGNGPNAGWAVLGYLVPVAAAVLAARTLLRHLRSWQVEVSAPRAAALAAASGASAGALLGVLAWLSGGALLAGRMAAVGPSPWQVGLVLALEVALPAALVAAVAVAQPLTVRWTMTP